MIENSIQSGLIFYLFIYFFEYFDSYNKSRVDRAQMHSGSQRLFYLFLLFSSYFASLCWLRKFLLMVIKTAARSSILSYPAGRAILPKTVPTKETESVWLTLIGVAPIICPFLSWSLGQRVVMLWYLDKSTSVSGVRNGSKLHGLRMREGWFPRGKLGCYSQKKVEWIQQKQWLLTTETKGSRSRRMVVNSHTAQRLKKMGRSEAESFVSLKD